MERLATRPKPLFLFIGIGGLIAGAIHLLSLSDGATTIKVGDTIINTVFGLLGLGVWFFLERNFRLAILLFAVQLVASLVYPLLIGRGFNVISLVIGVYIAYSLYIYKSTSNGEGDFQEK